MFACDESQLNEKWKKKKTKTQKSGDIFVEERDKGKEEFQKCTVEQKVSGCLVRGKNCRDTIIEIFGTGLLLATVGI